MEAINSNGPVGFRYSREEDLSEIIVYPCPIELTGGAVDGEVVAPAYSLDLEMLRSAFKKIDDVHWIPHGFGPYDNEGSHISIEGIYRGQKVYLKVLAYAPDDEEPGMKLDATLGKRVTPQ